MAEDKQLTVAELLARNAKERAARDGGSADVAPRRRRRRSVEEGGVSVAELTGSINKVEATPAQAKHTDVDIDQTAPVIPAPKQDAEEFAAQKQAKAEEQAKAEMKAEQLAKAEEIKKAEFARKAKEAREARLRAQEEQAEKQANVTVTPSNDDTTIIKKIGDSQPDETGVIPVVEASAPQRSEVVVPAPAQTNELEAESIDDFFAGAEEEELEEDTKLNPVAIVLLALLGIVLGAVVFKGFEILWHNFSHVIVAVLAVAVTAIMAGIVHALRTENGKGSMVLAVICGLVLTFGPLLIA